MAELLKTLDARVAPDQSASRYFVVICARRSDNPLRPGHAFVVWGKEDAAAGMSSQIAFGFYPKDGNTTDVLLGNDVPGQVLNEALQHAPSSLLTARVIAQVNKSAFDQSQREIERWKTADYNLYEKNCISFVGAVSSAIGLIGVPTDVAKRPPDYFENLVAMVDTSFGGVWQTDDPSHRFAFAIIGSKVVWTEKASDGSLLQKQVETSNSSSISSLRVDRENTDDVLQFLGFSSPQLRAEILAKKPEPSFVEIKRSGTSLSCVWHGLLVKKLANGHLDQIVQPSQGTPKNFVLVHP